MWSIAFIQFTYKKKTNIGNIYLFVYKYFPRIEMNGISIVLASAHSSDPRQTAGVKFFPLYPSLFLFQVSRRVSILISELILK